MTQHQLLIGNFFVTATLEKVVEGDLKGKIIVKFASNGNIIRIGTPAEVSSWAKAVKGLSDVKTTEFVV